MSWIDDLPEIVVAVGSGGVGKTTTAAALAVASAERGRRTLVMTFDPSHRLKDALGLVSGEADVTHRVELEGEGLLDASLIDAKATFDRLVRQYAPDEESRERVLQNPFYQRLGGSLSGILEYMAVERLFEVVDSGEYDRIVLDTPPIANALDFLEAPGRIVRFLDSGVRRIAARKWFDDAGRLQVGGLLKRRLEKLLDEVVGVSLLRDMVEFFAAFDPLFAGFRQRAQEVEQLLRSERTLFLMVAGPGEQRVPEVLYFARRLVEAGHRLGPIVVNRVFPALPDDVPETGNDEDDSLEIAHWLAERDRRGLRDLAALLPDHDLLSLPLMGTEPADVDGLRAVARALEAPAV